MKPPIYCNARTELLRYLPMRTSRGWRAASQSVGTALPKQFWGTGPAPDPLAERINEQLRRGDPLRAAYPPRYQ